MNKLDRPHDNYNMNTVKTLETAVKILKIFSVLSMILTASKSQCNHHSHDEPVQVAVDNCFYFTFDLTVA